MAPIVPEVVSSSGAPRDTLRLSLERQERHAEIEAFVGGGLMLYGLTEEKCWAAIVGGAFCAWALLRWRNLRKQVDALSAAETRAILPFAQASGQ